MLEWLFVPSESAQDVAKRLGRVWRGSATITQLRLTSKARPCLVIEPETMSALTKPRWPDVLTDWVDIYEEPLFPSPRLPVAGELLSEAGGEVLAVFADLGDPAGARGGTAWYQKGGLIELEQVGRASVAWQKGQPLSRPKVSDARAQLAAMGRSFADTARDAGLYDRVEAGRAVTAEAVLLRAILRMVDADPPAINELAELLRQSPHARMTL